MPIKRKSVPRRRRAFMYPVMFERDLVLTSQQQAKEDASQLLQKKVDMEKEKKILEESVLEKDLALQKKLKTIGNYVHESVPISNNEA